MTPDTLPRIDHIIIAAKDVRIAAKHFLDTYGLASELSPEPVQSSSERPTFSPASHAFVRTPRHLLLRNVQHSICAAIVAGGSSLGCMQCAMRHPRIMACAKPELLLTLSLRPQATKVASIRAAGARRTSSSRLARATWKSPPSSTPLRLRHATGESASPFRGPWRASVGHGVPRPSHRDAQNCRQKKQLTLWCQCGCDAPHPGRLCCVASVHMYEGDTERSSAG